MCSFLPINLIKTNTVSCRFAEENYVHCLLPFTNKRWLKTFLLLKGEKTLFFSLLLRSIVRNRNRLMFRNEKEKLLIIATKLFRYYEIAFSFIMRLLHCKFDMFF